MCCQKTEVEGEVEAEDFRKWKQKKHTPISALQLEAPLDMKCFNFMQFKPRRFINMQRALKWS